MSKKIWIVCVAAALLLAGLVGYRVSGRREPSAPNSLEPAESASTTRIPETSGRSAAGETILKLRPGQVLASVNHRELTLRDLMPLKEPDRNETELSLESYQYLLDRAVNRELILQAAKTAGVQLDESRKEQLASLRSVRTQVEPGGVARLNSDATELEFELQEAGACMLQTALLETKGFSPNITREQVLSYYQQHRSEFAELPSTSPEREQAWNEIDFQIRQSQAPHARAEYQTHLTAYMSEIRSQANVVITPIDRL